MRFKQPAANILSNNGKKLSRIFLWALIFINPLFGLIYQQHDPSFFEPVWPRLINSASCIITLYYSYAGLRKHASVSLYISLLVHIVVNNWILLGMNNFRPEYFMGAILTFVIVTFFCRSATEILLVILFNLFAMLFAFLLSGNAQISVLMIAASATIFGLLGYLAFKTRQKFNSSLENALKETASLNSNLLEAQKLLLQSQKIAGLGYWEYTIEKKELFLSDNLYDIFQLSRDVKNLNRAIASRLHPNDNLNVKGLVLQAVKAGKEISLEHRMILPDKSVVDIYCAFGVVKNEHGRPVKISGISQNITPLRKTEARLEQSKKELHSLISSIDDIVFEIDSNMVIINIWCRDESLLFQPLDKFLNQTIVQAIGPRQGNKFIEVIHEVNNTSKTIVFDFPSIIGSGRWFQAKITPIVDHAGNYKGHTAAVITEVTDKVLAREQLKQREVQLSQAQKTAHIGSWTWDLQTNDITWSENVNSILEVPEDYLAADTFNAFINLVHPDDRHLFYNSSFIGPEKPLMRFDHRIVTPGGKLKYLSTVSGETMYDEDGNAIKMVGIIQDITERKRTEIEFRETEKRFRDVLENIRLIAVTLDIYGNVIFCNDYVASLLGYSKEEMMALNWFDTFVKEDVKDYFKMRIITGDIDAEYENPIYTRAGEERLINWFNSVLRNNNGRVIGVTSIGEDITEKKKAEEALIHAKDVAEKAAQSKSDFLSIISHEIRTPMNAVIGIAHLLLQEEPKPEQLDNLDTLKYSAENLLALINDILDYNKIEAGKLELENLDFSLKNFILNIRQVFQQKAEEKNIAFKLFIDDAVPDSLCGDTLRITQILNNLISNAVKFTAQGEVGLSIRLKEADADTATIEFAVHDTGIGIKGETANKIFEPFMQENQSTTRLFGGTGLGLAITKKLVELLNGEIYYKNNVGDGTTFSFIVALKRGNRIVKSEREVTLFSSQAIKSLKGMKVLIVDDNEINLKLASKFLHNWQVETDTATDGQIALDKSLLNNYDIIIMDLQMPVMDGYTSARLIRKQKPNQTIIALTADAMPETSLKAIEAGMTDYFTKPFVPALLYNKLKSYYSEPLSSN